MKLLMLAVASAMALASAQAWAWSSLTPQEALAGCYAGDPYACEVLQEYQRYQQGYGAGYPQSPADSWVAPDEVYQEKPGPFSPGELAR